MFGFVYTSHIVFLKTFFFLQNPQFVKHLHVFIKTIFFCFKDQVTLEGMVVQRAECRPAVNESYMKLKK